MDRELDVRVAPLSRLDAEGGEQNEVASPRRARRFHAVERGLVVNSERVGLGAGAGGEARDHDVDAALGERRALTNQRCGVAHLQLHDLGALELGLGRGLGRVTHHGGGRVATAHRLAHDRLANVTRRADDAHALARARLARCEGHPRGAGLGAAARRYGTRRVERAGAAREGKEQAV